MEPPFGPYAVGPATPGPYSAPPSPFDVGTFFAQTASPFAPARPAVQPTRGPDPALAVAQQFVQANSRLTADELRARQSPNTLTIVDKTIKVGPRGGGSYLTGEIDPRTGKPRRNYLKKHQKEQCREGTLAGSGNSCPANITGYKTGGVTRTEEAALAVMARRGRAARTQ